MRAKCPSIVHRPTIKSKSKDLISFDIEYTKTQWHHSSANLSRMRNTIVPLYAEYQVVEIGDNSLALLRKMLQTIKVAFALLCFIPIFVGILFVTTALFIELLLKVCSLFHFFPAIPELRDV